VWTQGAIRHTAVIPIAGDQITNDIAMALRTPTARPKTSSAVRLCAAATGRPGRHDRRAGVGDRPSTQLSRQALADVIQPRVEELFELVQAELRRSGFEERLLSSGIVLTGGAAQMPGMIELGEEIFHMPVRWRCRKYGALRDVVRNPRYSTAMGLLLEGQTQRSAA
jgi:cell division protein FtsA